MYTPFLSALSFSSEINLRLLKENIELFFKKESNFKRPLKIEMIFAKLTKGFVPHYEWNGHRRRIPWKLLKKDQTVNKFPSAFFTTKTGLHQSLQQLHWYSPFPVSSFFPRCYQVSIIDSGYYFFSLFCDVGFSLMFDGIPLKLRGY